MKLSVYRNATKNYIKKHNEIIVRPSFFKILLLSVTCIFSTLCAAKAPPATSQTFAQRPAVKKFMRTMEQQHHFKQAQLERWFSAIKTNPDVIKKMTTPHEAKAWYEYRPLFIKNSNIQEGELYWQTHKNTFEQVEKKFGVPTPILLAIIGVETHYGKHLGSYPVLQTLATLSFDYPARASYFKKELREYLLLCREEGFNPLEIHGSYAGAMGIPQFMPSSYRHYAVGLHSPLADLIHKPDHAIASVGHYLASNGWQKNAPVAVPAVLNQGSKQNFSTNKLKPQYSLKTLSNSGIKPSTSGFSDNTLANLIRLQTKNHAEYWLGFHNFYVITRYNTSTLYAMAVYQLSEAIKEAHRKEVQKFKKI